LLGTFSGDCDFNVCTRLDRINLCDYHGEMALNARPARRQQNDDRQLSIREALLITQILIGCHQRVETRGLGLTQQLTVLELTPPQFVGGSNVMFSKVCAQRDGRALVKEDAHLRNLQGLGGAFQNHTGLLGRDAWKPPHEIRQLRPVFKVLEQGGYGHARAAKHPGATYALGISLYGRADAPVDHGKMLARAEGCGKCA
jgi:hypothetical protein